MVHYMATLGTGSYKPVIYEGVSQPEEFVQVAELKKMLSQGIVPDKVSIFLTEKACEQNWEDSENIEGDKRGLYSQLKDILPNNTEIADVPIPDGKNEEEQMETFNIIFDAIGTDDEIYFDLTHGFRSIPIFAFTVINYAKELKNVKVMKMFYGAFEAKYSDDGIVPVFDASYLERDNQWDIPQVSSYCRRGKRLQK